MKNTRYILGLVIIVVFLLVTVKFPFNISIYPHLSFLWLLKRGITIILISAFLCLWRVFRGPDAADRIVSMDMLGILIMGICALLSISTKRSWYMDIGIAWGLQSFISTLAFTKFFEGKDFDE